MKRILLFLIEEEQTLFRNDEKQSITREEEQAIIHNEAKIKQLASKYTNYTHNDEKDTLFRKKEKKL